MLALYEQKNSDPCVTIVKKYYDSQGMKETDVLSGMLSCLYRIGAIGVKTGAMDTVHLVLCRPVLGNARRDKAR